LDRVWHDVSGTLLGVLDLFSGGNFRLISVFALGVTPYITSSIILQLMTVVSPQLKNCRRRRDGAAKDQSVDALSNCRPRRFADFICRSLVADQRRGCARLGIFLTTVLTLTTGTMFVMWLGEQITDRGVGNGISLLILPA